MLTTLHLICVESLNRYREQTNEGDGQTTTPSRCICNPPTGGLDTPLQVTSKSQYDTVRTTTGAPSAESPVILTPRCLA
jgi:hypothetical protein